MGGNISRRGFMHASAALGVAAAAPRVQAATKAQSKLPRWRGFNLLYFFSAGSDGIVPEDDFRFIQDLGFDFARLPMTYTHWIEGNDVYAMKEATLEKIDGIVEFGAKHGIHISLNFHRGPGYSVNREREEPYNLWKDQEALDAFCFHWKTFAERYRGIPSDRLSFDLINEPPSVREDFMSRADHERVVRATVKAIRDADPARLILADGLSWGNEPIPELADLGIGQSTRGYQPMAISHHQASWVNSANFPAPAWPLTANPKDVWDRPRIKAHYAPWADLARQGVGVHCGECGCYNKTPHDVFLAWFRDVLDVLTGHNIGYALWNLRGSFGLLDSERADVDYEDWHGHQLDRKLLDVMQAH